MHSTHRVAVAEPSSTAVFVAMLLVLVSWIVLSTSLALPATAQPVLGFACDSNSDCTGVDEACVFDRCVRVRCNSDLDCTHRLPLCLQGVCQDLPACDADSDCSESAACISGRCQGVQCRATADCPGGRPCVDHKCAECATDTQCGANGACRRNNCVCVQCNRDAGCALDQACRENACVPFCAAGEVMIPANDGARTCRTCVNPETARRCGQFPGCRGNTSCVQGFCIPQCRLEPPDFDRLLDDFSELELVPDPDGTPFCPKCRAIFTLAGLRGALERHGIDQPVVVRLLDDAGREVAELGSFHPKGKSWESVPLRVQPKLAETGGAPGLDLASGCGYALEVRSLAAGGKAVRGEACVRVRKAGGR